MLSFAQFLTEKTDLEDEKPDYAANFVNHLHWADDTGSNLTESAKQKGGPSLMDLNPDVQFYDYTKNFGRVIRQSSPNHPQNYHLALSHTGSGEQTNDHQVAMALDSGNVVASVYKRRKSRREVNPDYTEGSKEAKTLRIPLTPEPKGIIDDHTGKVYPGTGGDEDDNTFDRHNKLGIPNTRGIGHNGQGVVSTLELKGVTIESAGSFANEIHPDGYIHINSGRTRAEVKKAPAKEEDIDWSKMPNASRIRDIGREEAKRIIPEGMPVTIYMRKGLASAYEQIPTMDTKSLKKRVSEARQAYKQFRKVRGVETGANLMKSNGKTDKSSGEGVLTIGLAMAPHHLSGLANVCPHSSTDCRANCLGTEAGTLRGDANVSAKMIRTQFVFLHPEHAGFLLHDEITKHKKKAEKKGLIPGVRLNIVSDIDHENIHK